MDVLETLAFILPVISAISVLILICLNAYTNIRSKFPIKVNCWFCNVWLKVPYNKQNSWNCPNCEQYNGFTPGGDYNQTIPAQYDELMNKAVPLKTKTCVNTENRLCNICNHNQRLKVHQLATFSPLDETKYDEEIDRYKEQLERSYRLCPQCEKVLNLTLQKQKSTILDQQLKLKTNNKSSTPRKKNTAKISLYTKILNNITIVIVILLLIEILIKCILLKKYHKSLPMKLLKNSLILTTNFLNNVIDIMKNYFEYFYSNFKNIDLINDIHKYLLNMTMLLTNNNFIKFYIQLLLNVDRITFLTIIGSIAQLLILTIKNNIEKIDFFKTFAWISITTLQFTNIISQNYSEIVQIILASFIIISWVFATKKSIKIKKSPMKKQKCPKISLTNDTLYNDFKPLDVTEFDKTFDKTQHNSSFNSSRSISPLSTSSLYDHGFAFYKSTKDSFVFGQKAIFSNPFNINKFSPEFRAPSVNLNDSNSSQNSLNNSDDTLRSTDTVNYAINELSRRQPIENELGEEFKKLHLGSFSVASNNLNKLPSVFKITSVSRPKPVLTPPKLSSVTQSSWVAGGYWKPPYEYSENFNSLSSLSRSSSQSSGFGSQSSSQNLNSLDLHNSLPNSRNTSICGEFDKFSVFSEPPYHYNKNNTRVYTNLPQDQPLYIYPRKVASPTSVLNDSWRSCDSSFRPSSRNSLLSQNFHDFNSNRSINSENTSKCYKNGYTRGSLYDDWHKNNFK